MITWEAGAMQWEAGAMRKDGKARHFHHGYPFPVGQNRVDFIGSGGAKMGFLMLIYPQALTPQEARPV